MVEKTLVLIKPDGVARGLVGEILSRFERTGLQIIGLKIVKPTREDVERHYPDNKDFLIGMGKKTLENFAQAKLDVEKYFGTKDPLEIGRKIREWNVNYLTSGPCVAILLKGPNAISCVRKLVGHTLPMYAEAGTIRGDFSTDSSVDAALRGESIKNLIHASGSPEESAHEEKVWFRKEEIID